MSNVKGSIFKYTKEYVVNTYGHKSWYSLLSLLTPDERDTIEMDIYEDKWYPVSLLKRVIGAFDNTFASGEFKTIVPIAKYIAEKDIMPIFKKFSDLKNIPLVLRNAPALWKRYFDTGEMRVENALDEERAFNFTFHNFDDISTQILCSYLISTWLRQVLKSAGADNVSIIYTDTLGTNHVPSSLEVTWS
ncbi:MAG: hypothetical protein IH874_04500 [Candidatus Dadabacteria bacterium]|nr:hypothetical protein [Candidatus Dadabacteria bacterium]